MKVLSFGELLLRLTAPGYTRLFQKDSLDTSFCGGEANVAVSLAVFGVQSQFVTRLPFGDVGMAAEHSMRLFGVDTSKIVYGDGRMGLYYLEKGVSQRPSKVIYDRSDSAFALSKREDFNWKELLADVDWLHWTGISPALSDEMIDICMDACKEAKRVGVRISCDLNYRSSLWSEAKAKEVMCQLMPYVDVCIANEEDADKVLGIRSAGTDVSAGKLNKSGYIDVAQQISSQYGCEKVAITLRESISASRNGWSGMLYDHVRKESCFSRYYDIQIVDRVGAGDSFAAGIIYALVHKMDNQQAIEFATAASCLKHTIEGDYNRISVEEVNALITSGGNGRVKR